MSVLVKQPASHVYQLLPPPSTGWHQSKWGYKTLQNLEDVVGNYSAAGIPLDTIWSDIDFMDAYRDFTVDPVAFPLPELQSFVARLHRQQQHYVVIVDPGTLLCRSGGWSAGSNAGVGWGGMVGRNQSAGWKRALQERQGCRPVPERRAREGVPGAGVARNHRLPRLLAPGHRKVLAG